MNNIVVGTALQVTKKKLGLVIAIYNEDGNHNQPRCIYIDDQGHKYKRSCNTIHEWVYKIHDSIILTYRYTTDSQLHEDFNAGRFNAAFDQVALII